MIAGSIIFELSRGKTPQTDRQPTAVALLHSITYAWIEASDVLTWEVKGRQIITDSKFNQWHNSTHTHTKGLFFKGSIKTKQCKALMYENTVYVVNKYSWASAFDWWAETGCQAQTVATVKSLHSGIQCWYVSTGLLESASGMLHC